MQLRALWSIASAPKNSRLLKHPAYVPVGDLPELPRVLVLGDSISIGYTLPMRKRLKGLANVHRPQQNCLTSRNALQNLDQWLGLGNWDVIHFNFGLHDISIEGGKPIVPASEYSTNLNRLADALHVTGAKLVWASTTPVPKDATYLDPLREAVLSQRAEDVRLYNQIAATIMHSRNIPINDLYQFSQARLTELQIAADIHFSSHGYAVLGTRVADFLLPLLP